MNTNNDYDFTALAGGYDTTQHNFECEHDDAQCVENLSTHDFPLFSRACLLGSSDGSTHWHDNGRCFQLLDLRSSRSRARSQSPQDSGTHFSKHLTLQSGHLFGGDFHRHSSTTLAASYFGSNFFNYFRDTLFGVEGLEGKSFVSRFITTTEGEDFVIKLVEDLMILIHAIFRSNSSMDRHVALVTFLKLRGSPIQISMVAMAANQIYSFAFLTEKPSLQSDEFFSEARSWIDSYDRLKKTTVFRKTHRFCMFLLGKGICDKFGMGFDYFNYSKLEKAAIAKDFTNTPNMIHCILDTVLFFCETGVQCFKTGSLSAIFHSGTTYQRWYEECSRLRILSLHTGNIEPHGTTLFQFISDLKKAIEQGNAIMKFSVLDKDEKKLVASILDKMKMIDAELLTRSKAMEERKAPFSLLIHGATAVAKSSFKQLCFYHFGRVMGLPLGDNYKYTRTPGADHWDNFSSSMWCAVTDDAGYMSKLLGIPDPSVMELIQMINNVAYVPAQADLPDKGRTPFLCKLVMATTNSKTLNAHAYFSHPVAVARRFPYVVNLELKSEFCDDQGMVDPRKMPPPSDSGFPDVWLITIERPVARAEAGFAYEKVTQFSSVYDFLRWMTAAAQQHEVNQTNAMETNKRMVEVRVCKFCFLPMDACSCEDGFCDGSTEASQTESAYEREEILTGVRRESRMFNLVDEMLNPLPTHVGDLQTTTYREMLEETLAHDKWKMFVEKKKIEFLDSKERMWQGVASQVCNDCDKNVTHFCDWQGENVMFLNPKMDSEENMDLSILGEQSIWFQFKVYIYLTMVSWACSWFWGLLFGFWWGDGWKFTLARKFFTSWQAGIVLMRMLGHRFERKIGYKPALIKLVGAITAATVAYKILSILKEQFFGDEECSVSDPKCRADRQAGYGDCMDDVGGFSFGPNVERIVTTTELHRTPQKPTWTRDEVEQGNSMSTHGRAPTHFGPIDDTPWYMNDPFIPTALDVSQQSRCAKSQSQGVVLQAKIERNVAVFNATVEKPGPDRHFKVGVGLNVHGNIWMTNNHGLPPTPFYLTVIRSSQKECVTPNLRDILVTSGMVRRNAEKDLAFIELRCIPAGYNLIEYFPGRELQGVFNGYLIGRERSGDIKKQKMINIRRSDLPFVYDGDKTFGSSTWNGHVETDTTKGQCGSALVVECDVGVMILGYHFLGGSAKVASSVAVFRDELKSIANEFRSPNFECGPIPFSAPTAPRALGPVHAKSPVLFTQSGTAHVFGSFKGFRADLKSKFRRTLIADACVKRGYVERYVAPPMGYMPYWNALQDMKDPVVGMDFDVLEECKQAFLAEIFEKLPQSELDKVHVYDDNSTMNGVPGIKFCNSINRNTSIGAPFSKSKRHFLVPLPSGKGEELVEYSQEIQDRIEEIYKAYDSGKMFHPQFTGSLKDNPMKLKKALLFMTRMFCGAEGAWSFVVRKFYLSLVELVQRNKYIFESCPGSTAQSSDWHEMFRFLTALTKKHMVAGDFAKYDKKIAAILLRAAFEILIAIAMKAGFAPIDIHRMQGIMLDTIHAFVDFNGTLIQFLSTNPSGHALTVIINGLCHSLYMRYCFKKLCPKNFKIPLVQYGDGSDVPTTKAEEMVPVTVRMFQKLVHLLTYGDDGAMGVSPLIPWFNHTAIQGVLADIGVGYTMADKTAKSVPYIPVEQVSFLKRTWRYSEELGKYVGPIEEESIEKALTCCIAKGTTCPESRDVDAISTALREYFFFGRGVFEEKRLMFQDIVRECKLECYCSDSTFPTWEELVQSYHKLSKHVKPWQPYY